MFFDNYLFIALKMKSSVSIQPQEKGKVEFTGNQYLIGRRIIGMPNELQNKNKSV